MNNPYKTTVCLDNVIKLPSGDYFLSGKNRRDNRIKVIAKMSVLDFYPTAGENWEVQGEWRYDKEYGRQLHPEKASLVAPSGELLVKFLSNHPDFTGISDKRAKKLWDKFGVEIYRILDESDEAAFREKIPLSYFPEKVLINLFIAWEKHSREIQNIRFLQQHGFPAKLAKDIMYWDRTLSRKAKKTGFSFEFAAKRLPESLRKRLISVSRSTAIQKITDNPYLMLAFCRWAVVDKFAKRLGIKNDDYRRRMAAVYAILYEAYKEGHTCVYPESLILSLKRKIGAADKSHKYEATISSALKRRIYAVEIDNKTVYQAYGPHHMEASVKTRIDVLSEDKNKQVNLFQLDLQALEKHINGYEIKHNIKLHKYQRKAIFMAMTNNVSVITGGAGVGKTTVLRCILSAMEKCKEPFLQMALAGRAAHQMRLATGRDAMTIFAFLNRLKEKELKLGASTRLIIDEASMLDLPDSYQIFKKLRDDGKLLFVGDPYQLPPVGPGLVFNKLVDSSTIPTVELTYVHRQDSSTGIPQIAYEIRNGRVVDFDEYRGPQKGVYFVDCQADDIASQVRELYEDLGGFNTFDEVQVLAAEKGKSAGTTMMNNVLRSVVLQGAKRTENINFVEGDTILYTANDYQREIWNGSLGKITTALDSPIIQKTEYGEKRIIALANFDDREIELADTDFFRDIQHGFAITIHKAQGSQFKRVIIPVRRNTWNLDLTMVYTALTRGIEQVIFVGEREAVSEAILGGARSHQRNVALSFEPKNRSTRGGSLKKYR